MKDSRISSAKTSSKNSQNNLWVNSAGSKMARLPTFSHSQQRIGLRWSVSCWRTGNNCGRSSRKIWFLGTCARLSTRNSSTELGLSQVIICITSVEKGNALVKFVDWGNKETVPVTVLRQIPQKLQYLPPLCCEVELDLVKALKTKDPEHLERMR